MSSQRTHKAKMKKTENLNANAQIAKFIIAVAVKK